MAYRFNPPPNWPIDDPNWSPPPGWQPDPSWGPAPEGWDFWVEAEQAPESTGAEGASAPADQPAPEDDATRMVQTGQDEDATHVADSGQLAAGAGAAAAGPADAAVPGEDDATHVAGSEESSAVEGEAAPAADAGAAAGAETAEYQGPDHEAGLAQQAPYESAAPTPGYGDAPAQDQADAAAAGAAYGAAQPGAEYGQAVPGADYGQAAPGYGQAAPDYGQASPAPGYGQASPAPGYGQPSPAPGYGQGSPSMETGSGWTASTATGEAPQKSVLQRFWWVGCVILLVLALVIVAIGGIFLFTRNGDDTAGGGGETTTSEETTVEEPTEEEPTDEATEEEATEEAATPTNLPTIDPAAEEDAKEWVSMDGAGTVAVQMEYIPASDLPNTYGGTVDEGQFGDYLAVTAKLTVTEGTMDLNPFQFSVVTPYGGEVEPALASYQLSGSGFESDAPTTFEAGDEYTIMVLFDVQKAGGNTLNFTTYSDDYTWEVPA
ncbi:hypothetical protein [Brachybacterium sp. YJGR34]|uniref:hypothetical protein n=1 Tax=Brachybacterium sp. YJGR34 TaxID=2059911 RepID=UPI000E09E4FB|nr:hypothetical protein [Brachybacterium sp. YJGR34]